MSDYVYRCERCGELRIVHNMEGYPPEKIETHCCTCWENGVTTHTLTDCGRLRFDLNDHTRLTVFSTESEESTLMILIEDMFSNTVLDLDRKSSTRLAIFLASEILGRGMSE